MKKEKLRQETIDISLELGNIGQGIKTGINNALIRPYRVLINEERRVGRVVYVFYQENATFFRIFGSFCYTSSGRLLFFPGLEKKKLLWDTASMARAMPTKDIDHFTIEADWTSWHVTTLEKHKEKNKWIPSRKLLEMQPKIFFWFGLSMRSPAELEDMPKKINWTFQTSDGAKAIDELKSANEAIWNILKMHPDEQLGSNDYLHFDVYLDNRQFRFLRKRPNLRVTAPIDRPALIIKEEGKSHNIPVRTHTIKLRNLGADILIVVSRHHGLLSNPVIITTTL